MGTALLDHFALLSCKNLPLPSSNFPSPETLTTLYTPKVKVGKRKKVLTRKNIWNIFFLPFSGRANSITEQTQQTQ